MINDKKYNITNDDVEFLEADLYKLENASTRSEKLYALYDLRDDLTDIFGVEDDEDDTDDGGFAHVLRK